MSAAGIRLRQFRETSLGPFRTGAIIFEPFYRNAARVYQQGNPYSLEKCLSVFRLYFQEYEDYMGDKKYSAVKTCKAQIENA